MIPKYSAGTANEKTYPGRIVNGYIKRGKLWTEDASPLLGNCDGENFDYNELDFFVDEKALKLCVIKD